jgi:2-polyprenyl-3-methyl-5-hydroxy-6-metoxy-1,4-benzoquinol methylase
MPRSTKPQHEDRTPPPSTHEDWAEWVKDYYRHIETYDWVDAADHLRGPETLFHRNRARVVRKLIGRYALDGRPILDAGCGTGLILRYLPPGSVGLDLNPRNIDVAAKRLPQHRLVLGDIEKMEFDARSFGTVVCTEVLEHVPDPQQAISEIWRVLLPGGILIGSVPSRSPLWKLRFLSRSCPAGEPFHNQYARKHVRRMLSSFSILQIGYSRLRFNVMFVARK